MWQKTLCNVLQWFLEVFQKNPINVEVDFLFALSCCNNVLNVFVPLLGTFYESLVHKKLGLKLVQYNKIYILRVLEKTTLGFSSTV